jgi:hypothetical protein
MDEDKLKDFLKSYAEVLREGIKLSEFKSGVFPLQSKVRMPARGIEITTANGHSVAFVSLDEGGGPSMPVGPAAMTFSRLFVDLANAYYEFEPMPLRPLQIKRGR